MPQQAALWPSPRNVLRQGLTIFSNEYYQMLIRMQVGRRKQSHVIKLLRCSYTPLLSLLCPYGPVSVIGGTGSSDGNKKHLRPRALKQQQECITEKNSSVATRIKE